MPATFTGVQSVLSAQFTLSHGITPSTGTIEVVVQDELPSEGTLTIYDQSVGVALVDCRVGAVSYRNGPQGRTAVVQIVDRRWRWQFYAVTGAYNVRTPSGAVDPATLKTARELATILLQAMGETADVSALPDEGKPEVDWDGENAARALADLCEQYNCRVLLGVDNRVSLVKLNEGADLPGGPIESKSGGVTTTLRPDRIVLVGAPWRFEVSLKLEAVGLETDFTVKQIDGLSYRPATGWASEGESFANVTDSTFLTADGSKTSPRELAVQSVFRFYRILDTATVSGLATAIRLWREAFGVTGETPTDDVQRWQLLPLADTLAQTYKDADGVEREKPAFCLGRFWHSERLEATNSPDGTKLDVGISVDPTRGLVQCSRQVVTLDPQNGAQAEAELRYYAAVECKDPATRQPVRYVRVKQLRKPTGTRPMVAILRRDEIHATVTAQYTDTGELQAFDTSTEDADKQADYYLNAAAKALDNPVSQQARYVGVQPIVPDGRIVQVTWETGTGGTFTTASVGIEHKLNIPSYEERRALEKLSPKQQAFRDKVVGAAKKLFGGIGR